MLATDTGHYTRTRSEAYMQPIETEADAGANMTMTNSDTPTIPIGETVDGKGGNHEDGLRVTLPVEEVLTGRAFATGKSGSGKSNSAGVICERLLDAGHPLLIIDLDGEYYSLKEKYEVLHVGGGEECELQIGPEHAERLAELALEQNVPIVVDTSGYLEEETRDEVVYEFARHLFAKEKSVRRPFLLVVEEIHEFIPEKGSVGDCGKMLIKVAKRGRKHGLGILGLSQRPADVKKDFITQCDWLLWHRLTWNNDTKVVRRVLNSEHAVAVEDFKDGEAFLQADFLSPGVQRVQMDRKQTFDAGATPGLDDIGQPDLKGVDDDLAEELEEISAETEQRQDELEKACARIKDLEEELEAKEERIERLVDLREMVEGAGVGPASTETTATIEIDGDSLSVPEELRAEVLEIKHERDEKAEIIDELRAERDKLAERVKELEEELKNRPSKDEYGQLLRDLTEFVSRHEDLLETVDNEIPFPSGQADMGTSSDQPDHLEPPENLNLLEADVVQEVVEEVADSVTYADANVWLAVTALADPETADILTAKEAADFCDVGRASTNDILKTLAEKTQIITRDENSRPYQYEFDVERARTLVRNRQRREELQQKHDELNHP